MKELLGFDNEVEVEVHHQIPEDKDQKQSITISPAHDIFSPTSAFTKFTPIQSPSSTADDEEPFISPPSNFSDSIQNRCLPGVVEDIFSEKIKSSEASDDIIKDRNENSVSLSNLSLCSTISIDSIDDNKNCRRGLAASARVHTYDKKVEPRLKRSISAVEPHQRKGRDFLMGNLKMEDLLFGFSHQHYDKFLETPVDDINSNEKNSFDNFTLSNEFLKRSDSVDKTSMIEQELLKSMSEFENIFESPLKPIPSFIPSPAPEANSFMNADDKESKHLPLHQNPGNKFSSNSASNR